MRQPAWKTRKPLDTKKRSPPFYARTIARYLTQISAATPLIDQVHGLLNNFLGSKQIIFSFYSKPTLLSVDARLNWVPPDLQPISQLDEIGIDNAG